MIFNKRFQYTRRGSINRRNEFERAEFWSNELSVYERNTNFDRTLRLFFSGVAVHQRRWLLTPPAHCVCRRSCRCCAILRALEDACTLLAALLTSLRVAMTRDPWQRHVDRFHPPWQVEHPTPWNGSRTLFHRKLGMRPLPKVSTPRKLIYCRAT